jgi:hypothetical protein
MTHSLRGIIIVAALFLTSSLAAQLVTASAVRRAEAPQTLGVGTEDFSAFWQRASSHLSPGGVHASVNSGAGDIAFIFPIVGSVAGSNGTFFKSETTLVNNLNRTQDIALYYFPAGGNSCSVAPIYQRMNPLTWYVWSDFVSTVFGRSGLGSVIVFAVTSAHTNVDLTASVDGFSRIWTPLPNSTVGTSSQSFPAEALEFNGGTRWSYGLRQDPNFRTNVGIFNYDEVSRIFDVGINGLSGSTSFTMTVGACTMALTNVPGGTYGLFELSMSARDGRALWYGFGSSNDNFTGDSWSSVPRQ